MRIQHPSEGIPHRACLSCAHLGVRCDGPNYLSMRADHWCDWCRGRKEFLGWTNQKVAELAAVSVVTVERLMSGNIKDLRYSTVQAVTKALVGSSWGELPCPLSETGDALARCDALEAQADALRDELDQARARHASAMEQQRAASDFLKDQLSRKDEQLHDRLQFIRHKDRAVTILGILLGIVTLALIVLLLVDLANPNIGFFWLDQ